MPVQSGPLPSPRSQIVPAVDGRHLPTEILLGILLTLAGLVITIVALAWPFLAFRVDGVPSIAAYEQVSFTLNLVEFLAFSLGFYLLLRGVLRFLPHIRVWSRLGPILILVGAVVGSVANAAEVALIPMIFPPYQVTDLQSLYIALVLTSIAGRALVTLGTILALVAVAFGVLDQRRSPMPPAAL